MFPICEHVSLHTLVQVYSCKTLTVMHETNHSGAQYTFNTTVIAEKVYSDAAGGVTCELMLSGR